MKVWPGLSDCLLQDAVDVFPDPGQLYPSGTPAVPEAHLVKFRTGMAQLLEVSDGLLKSEICQGTGHSFLPLLP